MNINIEIPDDLHLEFKKVAFDQRVKGRPIHEKDLQVDALKLGLEELKRIL